MSDEAINTSANTVLFMEIIKSGQTTINEYSSLHFGYIQLKTPFKTAMSWTAFIIAVNLQIFTFSQPCGKLLFRQRSGTSQCSHHSAGRSGVHHSQNSTQQL